MIVVAFVGTPFRATMRTICICACALASTGQALFAAVPPTQTVLMSENPRELALQRDWGYADAVVRGDDIYLSGVVAFSQPGENLEASYDRAFARIGEILKRAGADWSDVVEITSFHTDLTAQMPAIVSVKRRYMGLSIPAWTAVGVTRLIPSNGITEIKILAKLHHGQTE